MERETVYLLLLFTAWWPEELAESYQVNWLVNQNQNVTS